MTLAPSPARRAPALDPYRRRVGRLVRPTAPGHDVGHLITRVAVHWDVVGPHAAPVYQNPAERLEWRVRYADAQHAELFCDDVAELRPPTVDLLDDGRFVLDGEDLRVSWLEGDEADAAWRDLGW